MHAMATLTSRRRTKSTGQGAREIAERPAYLAQRDTSNHHVDDFTRK